MIEYLTPRATAIRQLLAHQWMPAGEDLRTGLAHPSALPYCSA
ncbi:hypothetical protein [Pseudomonas fluorescens]